MTSAAITTLDQAANARARLEPERDDILARKGDLLNDKEQHVLAAAIGECASSAALAQITSEEQTLDARLAALPGGAGTGLRMIKSGRGWR
ncbi:hypothetical protein WDZ92_46810 [Nostoc sp. NIES-2111]